MVTKITPIQLQQARQGDEQSLAVIVAKMLPCVQVHAMKAVCPGLEAEDAMQEGLIALFRAVQTYQPDKGAAFETYAQRCVAHAVEDVAKAAARKKHSPLNHSVPLEQQTAFAEGPEDITIQKEQFHIAMNRIYTHLSSMERQVLLLFLDGYSYYEIAQKLDKAPKAIDNAMVRVRRKLRLGEEPQKNVTDL